MAKLTSNGKEKKSYNKHTPKPKTSRGQGK